MNAAVNVGIKGAKELKDSIVRIIIEDGKNEPGTTFRDTDGIIPRESCIGPRTIEVSSSESSSVLKSVNDLINRNKNIYTHSPNKEGLYDAILKDMYVSIEDRFLDILSMNMRIACTKPLHTNSKLTPSKVYDNVFVCGTWEKGKTEFSTTLEFYIYDERYDEFKSYSYNLLKYKECIRKNGNCDIGTNLTEKYRMIKEFIPLYLDQLTRDIYNYDMSKQILFRCLYNANLNNSLFYYIEIRCRNAFDIVGVIENQVQEGKDCILRIYELEDAIISNPSITNLNERFTVKKLLQWDRIRLYNGVTQYFFTVPVLKYDSTKKQWYYEYKNVNRMNDLLNVLPIEKKIEDYRNKTKTSLF